MRREALELSNLLRQLDPAERHASELNTKLALLEMKLRQAGMSTDFLHGEYADSIGQHLQQEK